MTGTLWMVFTLISLINAQATLDKSGHVMLITYDIQGISKADAIQRVDIWFHVRGSPYFVSIYRYPTPPTPLYRRVMDMVRELPFCSSINNEIGDKEGQQ